MFISTSETLARQCVGSRPSGRCVQPFKTKKMAVFLLGEFSLIVDAADEDSHATIAFASDDCERDFRTVKERGAEVIAPPTKTGWGVIAAYLKGPGGLTVEIEEPPEKQIQ